MEGPRVERADGKARHVLVVDDDQETLALFRDALEDEGYRVTTVADPRLEPAAVAALEPDLLILDLRFGPERGGVDLLERLKGDPATRPVPVLVCSADHRLLDELRDRLLAWDCAVLPKPFGLDELLPAVAACLAPQPHPVSRGEQATAP